MLSVAVTNAAAAGAVVRVKLGAVTPGQHVSAFAAATDGLFTVLHLAGDAVYRTAGASDGIPVRVMLRRPDRIASFGETRLASSTTMVDVRTSGIGEPDAGDTLELDDRTDVIQDMQLLDAERLVWTLDTRPA